MLRTPKAINVTCPKCGAGPGVWCHRVAMPSTRTDQLHKQRREAYEWEQEKAGYDKLVEHNETLLTVWGVDREKDLLLWKNERTTARELRQAGFKIGEQFAGYTHTSEGFVSTLSVITLLWMGEEVAVWHTAKECEHAPGQWETRESAGWNLDSRKWYRIKPIYTKVPV